MPPVSVEHYENFPVASWLCPPRLRPPITAIYHFARCADDLADEGQARPEDRVAALQDYRRQWHATLAGHSPTGRWAQVFTALAAAQREFALPPDLLDDLLDAFLQDTANPPYPDRASLLDYCRRSANPIGRLLLHLYGVDDAQALARSDAICTALQLINFWQDFSVDHPRGRCYLPQSDLDAHGLDRQQVMRGHLDPDAAHALLDSLCDWTHGLMSQGAPLVHRLPGRAGWELRAVVQGGTRVLEKIRRMNPASFARRPVLGAQDMPLLLWRMLRMPRD